MRSETIKYIKKIIENNYYNYIKYEEDEKIIPLEENIIHIEKENNKKIPEKGKNISINTNKKLDDFFIFNKNLKYT